MNKVTFLLTLSERLADLPQDEVKERLSFYSEMIDDRMEDGLSEAEAVASVGSINEIILQIIADIPLSKIAKQKVKPSRRLNAGEIVLLVLGSPIWLSLLIALFCVILSLYLSLWAIVISLWAVFVSLCASSLGTILAGVFMLGSGNFSLVMVMFAAGLVCAGLSIFMFYACKASTKGTALLAKQMTKWIKRLFIKKEAVK